MGYAGGSKKNPTYHDLGDHSETLQLDFDPRQISYRRLLEVYWESHDPETPAYSRQYASVIFFHDDQQKAAAVVSKGARQAKERRVLTEISPSSVFYLAEAYHQKYYLRGVQRLMREFRAIYPSEQDFVNSTAVARANGYVAGYGTEPSLDADLPVLGLSSAGGMLLKQMVLAQH